MPVGRDPESDRDTPPSRRQRLRRVRSEDQQRAPLADRLRSAFMKPVDPDAAETAKAASPSVEQLEADVRSANDKERLVGLIAAPFAAAIGMLVIRAQIVNDPPARLKNGQIDTLHVNVSLYHDLTVVLIGLSVVMLVTAMLRKRLYLAIVMALYGLAIFNLHYWGFGVPFIMGGAWLMVRAYRLQRDLREATGGGPSRSSSARRGGGAAERISRPQPNKRYTPPRVPARRPTPTKAETKERAL
jgi:hypothetical protein